MRELSVLEHWHILFPRKNKLFWSLASCSSEKKEPDNQHAACTLRKSHTVRNILEFILLISFSLGSKYVVQKLSNGATESRKRSLDFQSFHVLWSCPTNTMLLRKAGTKGLNHLSKPSLPLSLLVPLNSDPRPPQKVFLHSCLPFSNFHLAMQSDLSQE